MTKNKMKIIFGLGNPGTKYQNTRHNAGVIFVDKLREVLGWDTLYQSKNWEYREEFEAETCDVVSGGSLRFLLVKPMTFMNLTGRSARRIVKKYALDVSADFVLVHDDLDIEVGKFKIQVGVSPKSHKGVRSVESALLKKEFLRVRIGVDSRQGDRSVTSDEYVLQKFEQSELELLDEAIVSAIKLLRMTTGV